MEKIILIERYSPSSFFWPNLIKYNKLTEFSVEKILNKYQGFEGDLITFFHVNDDSLELNQIKKNFLENKDSVNRFLFYLISGDNLAPIFLREHATQVGYDVGVCEEEKTIYSSIFNEIIFGNLEELVIWKKLLNENLLFPDKITVEKYVSLHNELSAEGKGVEDYEEMIIYEIWKL